jgi:hypothetical protein
MKHRDLFKKKGGINLDLGCSDHPNPGFIGIDKRKLPNVDIVHDLEVFPWPVPDNICHNVVGSHIIEHIKPWLQIDFLNEVWRVTKVGGKAAFVHPYGVNNLFIQDPTHCAPLNEASWQYYDPRYPLWQVYKPRPWLITKGFPTYQIQGMMECLMTKIEEKDIERVRKEYPIG